MREQDKMNSTLLEKILSANDTGETGGHQAGILIPKDEEILSFFPMLSVQEKNPRCQLTFKDETNCLWQFNFIYYNNRFFGGTRNEFRLTGMTRYFRSKNLKSGDTVKFSRSGSDTYYIGFVREKAPSGLSRGPLKLAGTWKVVSI